jgi:hypothetical protein
VNFFLLNFDDMDLWSLWICRAPMHHVQIESQQTATSLPQAMLPIFES